MISCKKATYLISQQEEKKLTIIERVQLSIHLKACSLCRLFKLQTNWMAKQLKRSGHDEQLLSNDKKQALKELFKNE